MSIQILKTKLFVPPTHPNLLPRPTVNARIEELVRPGCHLVLISSQAGSGKTSLLSEWLAASHRTAAWLSLDEEDNNLFRFWLYLAAALQTVQPDLAKEMISALQSPSASEITEDKLEWLQSLLTGLINEIAARLSTQLILVLDDYHLIHTPEIHKSLTFLIEHLPAQACLVMLTRADPPLPLTRLRTRGQMAELRVPDLRFSAAEIAAYLNEIMKLNVQPGDVQALEARTEGWIAGVQLAALSMQGRADPHEFVTAFTGSHHYILGYLTEEVLSLQPEAVQDFLLKTSILGRLNASLCDEVIGQTARGTEEPSSSSAQSILAYLERSNLFLIPLDDERRWYRYHHLFADLLNKRLRQEATPAQIEELHRRASYGFERSGDLDEAMKHALAGKDYEHAAIIIEANTPLKMNRGEMSSLLSWFNALPEALFAARPLLTLRYVLALIFAGKHAERLDELIRQAEAAISPLDIPENRDMRGTIAMIRGLMADMAEHTEQAIALSQEADHLLLPNNYLVRSLIPYILARSYRTESRLDESVAMFEQVANIGHAGHNIWTETVALFEMASSRRIQGRLHAAARLYQEAQQNAAAQGARLFGSLAKVDAGYATILREWGRLEEACDLAKDALERMRWWGNPSDLLTGYLALTRALISMGDISGAKEVLGKVDQIKRKEYIFVILNKTVEATWVYYWLAAGDLHSAREWAKNQAQVSGPPINEELTQIALAHILIATGEIAQALELLSTLAQSAEEGGRYGRLIEILLLQAEALYRVSKEGTADQLRDALQSLAKALSLAEPEGYIQVFLDEGDSLRELLHLGNTRHAWEGPAGIHALALLQMFDAHTKAPEIASSPRKHDPDRTAVPDQGDLIEPLSEREIEILCMICEGCSNQDIADRLVLALNTVKKHTSNIFGKLGVSSRTQAIAVARKLKLG